MEGQSDKASGTGHDAAVRTGREGLAGSSAGQVVAPSSEADAESKQKVVVSDSLFDLDDLVIRHREKRRVIMSLYETDGPQEAAASKIRSGPGRSRGMQRLRSNSNRWKGAGRCSGSAAGNTPRKNG